MLHELPVVLVSGSELPSLDSVDGDYEAHVLQAFKRLVKLFWIFDRSGAFTVIHTMGSEDEGGTPAPGPSLSTIKELQTGLQEVPFEADLTINDVQKADICVTRQWMQILLWRAELRRKQRGLFAPDSGPEFMATHPFQIASEFLQTISRLPNAALEAHGPTIEFKIYEIASAVTDAIAQHLSLPRYALAHMESRPNDILIRLQKMLAMCRGGNRNLLASLCARIVQIEEPALVTSLAPMLPPVWGDIIEEIREGQFSDGWSPDRVVPGNLLMDRQWDIARPPSSSSWFSLLAPAEPDDSSNKAHLGRERDLVAEDCAVLHQVYQPPQVNIGSIVETDPFWQPLALLSQFANQEDGLGHQDTSHSGTNMLESGTDSWFPAVFNAARTR